MESSIANICVMLAFVCHLFACVWGLQGLPTTPDQVMMASVTATTTACTPSAYTTR